MTVLWSGDDVIARFRRYLVEGHVLSGEDHLVPLVMALYRRLGEGVPVRRDELTVDLGRTEEDVEALLGELPDSTLDVDENGSIVAFGGLSLIPANHGFRVDGRDLYTWCVFDGLFLPELLSNAATSTTRCPVTNAPIEINLSPSAVLSSRPEAPVMSVVTPERDACCENLRGAFCNHVNFFADEGAFRAWAEDRTDVGHVSLREAHALAIERNHLRYGNEHARVRRT